MSTLESSDEDPIQESRTRVFRKYVRCLSPPTSDAEGWRVWGDVIVHLGAIIPGAKRERNADVTCHPSSGQMPLS